MPAAAQNPADACAQTPRRRETRKGASAKTNRGGSKSPSLKELNISPERVTSPASAGDGTSESEADKSINQ